MTTELFTLIDGQEVGRVREERNGRLKFTYNAGWRESRDAYPLSLSLPLARREHDHDPISAFLWGLLPDNERVLDTWARRFGVSAPNPFRLIANVGEDCAGAAQFVRPERVAAVRDASRDTVEWLTETDVAARLRELRTDGAAWRRLDDVGQFSLAGAHPKTALLFKDGRWGIPSGRTATTHILKPPSVEYDGFAENERLCLELAGALGLPAARSRVMRFEDQMAIVIERYDRIRSGDRILRIHQEDICQALGVLPTRRYEADGGPGGKAVVELLRSYSRDSVADIATFIDALILNWLIAGTDAHAKNYSILIGAGTAVRLAPLYDVVSALPYPSLSPHTIKLAMKSGGEYLVKKIGPRQWEKLALDIRISPDDVLSRVTRITERVAEVVHRVSEEAERDGLHHPIVKRFEEAVATRAAACTRALGAGEAGQR